jgi:hypothetical protein
MAGDRPSKGPEPGFQFRIPGRHRLYIPTAFVEAGSFSLSGQEILAPQQRANAAMRCVKMTRGPRPPVLPGRQIICSRRRPDQHTAPGNRFEGGALTKHARVGLSYFEGTFIRVGRHKQGANRLLASQQLKEC